MRFPPCILTAVTAAYLASFVLAVWVNPEVRFWREVSNRRDIDIHGIRAENPGKPIIFFTGGSSTAFSVDPAIIEDACAIPAINYGLPAGTGPRFIIDNALKATRPGDYLIVGLEPDFFSDHFAYPPGTLAFAMAVCEGNPSSAVGGEAFDARLGFNQLLNLPRPGIRYLLTLAYWMTTGKGYRYHIEDYRYHGRLETPTQNPALKPQDVLHPRKPSIYGLRLLRQIRDAADQRGVHVAYAMPWQYTSPQNAGLSRDSNRALLEQIGTIMPVIENGESGVSTDREHFSDSHLHLSATGSQLRSQALAKSLRQWLAQKIGHTPH